MMKRKLIVGLGNPEEERKETRHNIGWMCIDSLTYGSQYIEKKYGFVFETPTSVYLKPTVGMNYSGIAVKAAMEEYGFEVEDVLIIVDDLDIEFGRLRLKEKGGTRHNGLKSVENSLGTSRYDRLKFGIGHNFPEGSQLDYVLSPFTEEESMKLEELFKKIRVGIIGFYLSRDSKDMAINFING